MAFISENNDGMKLPKRVVVFNNDPQIVSLAAQTLEKGLVKDVPYEVAFYVLTMMFSGGSNPRLAKIAFYSMGRINELDEETKAIIKQLHERIRNILSIRKRRKIITAYITDLIDYGITTGKIRLSSSRRRRMNKETLKNIAESLLKEDIGGS